MKGYIQTLLLNPLARNGTLEVRIANTATLATIYDPVTGAPSGNPVSINSDGFVEPFHADAGIAYDLIFKDYLGNEVESRENTSVGGGQGPQGLQGPQGERGVRGYQGLTGATGADGADGSQGPAGIAGPQGNDGSDGQTGAMGPQGATGPQGDIGPQGPEGPNNKIAIENGDSNSFLAQKLIGDFDGPQQWPGSIKFDIIGPPGDSKYRAQLTGNLPINQADALTPSQWGFLEEKLIAGSGITIQNQFDGGGRPILVFSTGGESSEYRQGTRALTSGSAMAQLYIHGYGTLSALDSLRSGITWSGVPGTSPVIEIPNPDGFIVTKLNIYINHYAFVLGHNMQLTINYTRPSGAWYNIPSFAWYNEAKAIQPTTGFFWQTFVGDILSMTKSNITVQNGSEFYFGVNL